jgi:hypothetical protein
VPLSPAEQRELEALLSDPDVARQMGGQAAGSGDTWIDAGQNLIRGAAQGLGGMLDPYNKIPRIPGDDFIPYGDRPPVGSGMGYRTGQSVGRTLPTLGMGGALGQLALGLGGGAVAEGVQGATGSATAGNMAELGVNVGAMAAPYVARRLMTGAPGGGGVLSAQAELADRGVTGVNTGTGPALDGRTLPDTLQSYAEKFPGGTGYMQRFQRTVAENFKKAVDRFAGLTGRAAQRADDLSAGIAVQRDIERRMTSTIHERMAGITSRIQVEKSSPVILQETQQALQTIGGRMTGIAELDALAASPAARAAAGVADQGLPPTTYEAAVRLRSQIGRRLQNAGLTTDVATGELKFLYGALSRDLEETVAQYGGRGDLELWKQSRRLWAREMNRYKDELRTITERLNPEQVLPTVQRSPRTIAHIRATVSPETFDQVVAATFKDLGLARNSAQNAAGTAWSLETFLTQWSALGPDARRALLSGPRYERTRVGLEALARQAERVREINARVMNASQTSRGAAQVGTAATAIGALATGHVWPVFAIAAATGGAAVAARVMTKPAVLKWLAQSSALKPHQYAGAASRLLGILNSGNYDPEEAAVLSETARRLGMEGGR